MVCATRAQMSMRPRGEEVMNVTKQGTRYRIDLPEDLMKILRWHVANLPAGPMGSSGLLFPSETGGFRSMSTLDKPFRMVGTAIGLKKHVTPKGMRRTFQDLARRANVSGIVAREICGHATEAMQMHYSTVAPGEVRAAVAKIISMAGYKGLLEGRTAQGAASGAAQPLGHSEMHDDKKERIGQPLDGKGVSA